MKCSNANRGCEWVGTVGTLEKHVATCGFTLVPCPKQCKDDNDAVKCLLKKDLEEHPVPTEITSVNTVARRAHMPSSHRFMMASVGRRSYPAQMLDVGTS